MDTSKVKNFFLVQGKGFWENFVWGVKVTSVLLVVFIVAAVIYEKLLPANWQVVISSNAKAASDYLSSVLTSDRMKRFDHWFHIFFVGMFFGMLIWAVSAILLAIVVAGIMVIVKIERIKNHRLSAMTSLCICGFPMIIAYIVTTNQPVLGVIEKIVKFLDH